MRLYECCLSWFISCGHLNQDGGEVTWHALSLALIKMAASHMVAFVLVRSLAKMEKAAFLLFKNIYFTKRNVDHLYSML